MISPWDGALLWASILSRVDNIQDKVAMRNHREVRNSFQSVSQQTSRTSLLASNTPEAETSISLSFLLMSDTLIARTATISASTAASILPRSELLRRKRISHHVVLSVRDAHRSTQRLVLVGPPMGCHETTVGIVIITRRARAWRHGASIDQDVFHSWGREGHAPVKRGHAL